MKRLAFLGFIFSALLVLNGCAPRKIVTMDYDPLLQSDPKSILVVMPTDASNDIKAAPAVLSSTVLPLAEKGYYVMPVTMVNDTFNHNGVTTAQQMVEIPFKKLKETFGADAVLYLHVMDYSTNYNVLDSYASVAVKARLVDLNTGATLWDPAYVAVNNKESGGSSSLLEMLVTAVVKHVANNVTDAGYDLSRQNAYIYYCDGLQVVEGRNIKKITLLNGPRSPNYRKDADLMLYKKLNNK